MIVTSYPNLPFWDFRIKDEGLWSYTNSLNNHINNSVHTKLLQSCPALCNTMECSPQAPLSMGFSRQEYLSGLPCPPPGDHLDIGIEPMSPEAPALQVDSSKPLQKPYKQHYLLLNIKASIFQPGLLHVPLQRYQTDLHKMQI